MIFNNRYIFVHIPKVAGNSVRDALQGGNWKKRGMPPYRGHITLRDLIKKVGIKTINARFKFAFVRNPWDRTLSLYSHYIQKSTKYNDWKKQGFDFWAINTLEHLHTHIRWGEDHFLTQQVEWLEPGVDFVGRFEYLIEDFNEVSKHIGNKAQIKHNRRTSTNHKNYKDVYTEEAKEKVAKVFARDIDYFGFTFDSTAVKNIKFQNEN